MNHSRLPGSLPRPAYNDASLARAIRDGVDPAGRRTDPLMPRYELSETELDALIAYMKTLDAFDDPGVDASTIHLATVVAGRVDPARAQGTRRTRAWVRGKGITPTLFALTAANVALKHMIDHFSRDYFIERLEHYAEYSLSPSVYPRLSLPSCRRRAGAAHHPAGTPGTGSGRLLQR